MKKILFILLLPLTLFGQSQKISDMTSATSLTGSEYVPIVQTTNKKSTVTLLRGWASTIGTAGQLLKVNAGATALEFFTPTYLSGVVSIANGGTGLSALGTANQQLRVNAGATALEYFTPTTFTFSGITAATGTNTINNAANAQEWQWNTLGAGTGLLLSSSSTAAASNTNTLFRVNQTGANATSTQTTYSGYFSNTKTGTSATNIGLYSTATGGTTNWSVYGNGNIGLQIGSAPSATRQGYTLFDNTATERGFLGITSSAVLVGSGCGRNKTNHILQKLFL